MSAKKNGPTPKYQNNWAFRHNPNSRKTRDIMAINASHGLCRRCTDIVEWKRTYRKYKALTQAKKCVSCHTPTVRLAYHVLCVACTSAKGVCGKCMCDRDAQARIAAELDELNQQIGILRDTKGHLPGISQRERQSMLRECLRERQGLMDGEGGEDDEGLGGAAEGAGEGEEDAAGGAGSAAALAAANTAKRQARLDPGGGEEEEEDEEDEEGGDGEEEEEEEGEGAGKALPAIAPKRSAAGGYEEGLVDASFFTQALQQAKARQSAGETGKAGVGKGR